MNILSFFIIVPLLMLASLWASRSINQVRGVMVVGSSILLALSVYLTIDYIELAKPVLQERCCSQPAQFGMHRSIYATQ